MATKKSSNKYLSSSVDNSEEVSLEIDTSAAVYKPDYESRSPLQEPCPVDVPPTSPSSKTSPASKNSPVTQPLRFQSLSTVATSSPCASDGSGLRPSHIETSGAATSRGERKTPPGNQSPKSPASLLRRLFSASSSVVTGRSSPSDKAPAKSPTASGKARTSSSKAEVVEGRI